MLPQTLLKKPADVRASTGVLLIIIIVYGLTPGVALLTRVSYR